MKPLLQEEPGIAEQAARWIGSLEQGGAQEHAEFAAWLRASPQHVREFLLATAAEKEIDALDLQDFDVAQILKGAQGNVVRLSGHDKDGAQFTPLRKKTFGWAIAATVVLAAITGWWQWFGPGAWQEYSTGIGEQRRVELEDGSVVELNPSTQTRVRIRSAARDIQLRGGEALFSVERDPRRPFRVYSGDAVVRAIGTQFSVNRRASSVTISVLEGRVEVSRDSAPVSAPILSAGDQIKLVAGQQTFTRRTVDIQPNDLPRARSLTFSGDALADIVEDFNRYNRSPQIIIESAALRTRQFSGVFNMDDPESLIAYLAQDGRLKFERREGKVIIRER